MSKYKNLCNITMNELYNKTQLKLKKKHKNIF